MGWIPGTKMIKTYIHLADQDVERGILEMHGIKPAEEETSRCCSVRAACLSILETQSSAPLRLTADRRHRQENREVGGEEGKAVRGHEQAGNSAADHEPAGTK